MKIDTNLLATLLQGIFKNMMCSKNPRTAEIGEGIFNIVMIMVVIFLIFMVLLAIIG